MFLVRDIMYCKPGKARAMVDKFRALSRLTEGQGFGRMRIFTDVSAASGEFRRFPHVKVRLGWTDRSFWATNQYAKCGRSTTLQPLQVLLHHNVELDPTILV